MVALVGFLGDAPILPDFHSNEWTIVGNKNGLRKNRNSKSSCHQTVIPKMSSVPEFEVTPKVTQQYTLPVKIKMKLAKGKTVAGFKLTTLLWKFLPIKLKEESLK
jgi:hypothetical protein